jgi:hypothetical protein
MTLLDDALEIIDRRAAIDARFAPIAEALHRTPITFEDIPWSFAQATRDRPYRIIVSTNAQLMSGADAYDLAGTLVHEGKHVLDMETGLEPAGDVAFPVYLAEEWRGSDAERDFWRAEFPNNDHPAHNEIASMEHEKVSMPPEALHERIAETYGADIFGSFAASLFAPEWIEDTQAVYAPTPAGGLPQQSV